MSIYGAGKLRGTIKMKKHIKFISNFLMVTTLFITNISFAGGTWTLKQDLSAYTTNKTVGIWGSEDGDIFVVGYDGLIMHYDSNSWAQMNSGTTNNLEDVWGSGDNDVFAVGANDTILHYDGTDWESIYNGTSGYWFGGVWGTAQDDVFVVGPPGVILHYDGTSWKTFDLGIGIGEGFNKVWGNSSTDVFAVGHNGIIYHFDGINWSTMNSGYNTGLHGIWGSNGVDVFAVGGDKDDGNGAILHYNGDSWSTIYSAVQYEIQGVWGSSGTDVYVGGQPSGYILHFDGNSWSQSIHNTNNDDFIKFWGTSANNIYALTRYGQLWHYPSIGQISGQINSSVLGYSSHVVGAKITLVEINQSTTSDSEGNIIFSDIPGGIYTLKIEKNMFETIYINDISVIQGQTTNVSGIQLAFQQQVINCDLNGNGSRGIEDAIIILQELSGSRVAP